MVKYTCMLVEVHVDVGNSRDVNLLKTSVWHRYRLAEFLTIHFCDDYRKAKAWWGKGRKHVSGRSEAWWRVSFNNAGIYNSIITTIHIKLSLFEAVVCPEGNLLVAFVFALA